MRYFYRGQKGSTFTSPSYWALSKRVAKSYANLRGGILFTAKIVPKKVVYGEEPDLARKLGCYKEYISLRKRDDYRGAARLVAQKARKAGIDVRADDRQVVVFNPRVIQVVKKERI